MIHQPSSARPNLRAPTALYSLGLLDVSHGYASGASFVRLVGARIFALS